MGHPTVNVPVLYLIVWSQFSSVSSNLGIFNNQRSSNLLRFLCKIWFENGAEMARMSAFFSATATAALFLKFSATEMYATFFSSRQWRGGVVSI